MDHRVTRRRRPSKSSDCCCIVFWKHFVMPWWKEQGPGDDATSGYCSSMAGVIARVWSVVLVLSAAATITAAWFAFAAFDTAQTSSVCAFNRLNTLAANASLNSSATAVNASEIVPMALLTEVTTNMSTYKVLAVAPAFLAALLFLLAAMHILYPHIQIQSGGILLVRVQHGRTRRLRLD